MLTLSQALRKSIAVKNLQSEQEKIQVFRQVPHLFFSFTIYIVIKYIIHTQDELKAFIITTSLPETRQHVCKINRKSKLARLSGATNKEDYKYICYKRSMITSRLSAKF